MKLCVKPLSTIRSPYVLLAVTYVVGLGLLLMASVYPLLVALGLSRASAAAVIGSTCCLDLSPSFSNVMRAADMMQTDVVTYFVQSQLPVAVCVITTVTLGHFFVQRWFDCRDASKLGNEATAGQANDQDLAKAFEGAGPAQSRALRIRFRSAPCLSAVTTMASSKRETA